MLTPHFPSSRMPRPSLEMPKDAPAEPEAESAVLPSSTELFYFYGQSLEQCALKMGTGKVMWDLSGVWEKWLKVYAGALSRRLVHSKDYIDCRLQRMCFLPR
jgi:hypothetical protein